MFSCSKDTSNDDNEFYNAMDKERNDAFSKNASLFSLIDIISDQKPEDYENYISTNRNIEFRHAKNLIYLNESEKSNFIASAKYQENYDIEIENILYTSDGLIAMIIGSIDKESLNFAVENFNPTDDENSSQSFMRIGALRIIQQKAFSQNTHLLRLIADSTDDKHLVIDYIVRQDVISVQVLDNILESLLSMKIYKPEQTTAAQ